MGASAKQFVFAAAVAGAAFGSSPVLASSIHELQLDINSLTIQATNLAGANSAFGELTHTGKLIFTMDVDSTIALSIDGAAQSSFNASFYGLSGAITFVNGVSQGGSMTVKVQNTDTSIDTYSFDIAAGSSLKKPYGTSSFLLFGFQLDADTQHGFFNDANYGGTNIAPFYAGQNPLGLEGAFFQLKYVPDARGYSNNADVDILTIAETASVPLPSSAAAGLGLAGLLAVVQWRRHSSRSSTRE